MRLLVLSTGITGFALFILLGLVSFWYDKAHAHAVVYDYLDEALLARVEVRNTVAWSQSDAVLTRPFTDVDRKTIGKAANAAWAAFAVAQETGETGMLADYFSGVALQRATLAAGQSHLAGTRMVYLDLTGTPEFYHLDGSVFQARFQVLAVRFARGEDGLNLFRLSQETVVTTFMNKSTGWRVFSHERLSAEPVKTQPAGVTDMRMTGINYYPSATPWRAFWREFDIAVIEDDFDQIVDLGANAVRIFLPRDTFLPPDNDAHLENLAALLDAARARDLVIVPTLFDLKGSYALASWMDDAQYLRTVIPILAAHDAVTYVDIKNEPDLDFVHHGRAQIEAWIRSMAGLCRTLAPDLALTVGWSAADHAAVAAGILDLITYHEYQPQPGTDERLADVKNIAGDKPVMITEIGVTSWSALSEWPGSPRKQAGQLTERLNALNASDGVFVWTLHDFPNPDPLAVGNKPWIRNAQSEFGLFDKTGKPKPAAMAVRQGFARFLKGNTVD